MTSMTTDDVQCAIGTLETSFTYDPPSRWLESYDSLRALHSELTQQIKPYAWIKITFLAMGLAVLTGLLVWLFNDPVGQVSIADNVMLNVLALVTMWSIPGWLIAFGSWLTLRLASRRQPLVLFQHRIKLATARFHVLARDAHSETANAAS